MTPATTPALTADRHAIAAVLTDALDGYTVHPAPLDLVQPNAAYITALDTATANRFGHVTRTYDITITTADIADPATSYNLLEAAAEAAAHALEDKDAADLQRIGPPFLLTDGQGVGYPAITLEITSRINLYN